MSISNYAEKIRDFGAQTRLITMERSCQAQLLAEAAGKPSLIRPEIASLTHRQVGSQYIGWFNFQPLYEMVVRQEPDLLE